MTCTLSREKISAAHPAAPAPAWDEARAQRIIKKLVMRKAGMFESLLEFGLDDLISEALLAARKAWPRFNPRTAAASTFIYVMATSVGGPPRLLYCAIGDRGSFAAKRSSTPPRGTRKDLREMINDRRHAASTMVSLPATAINSILKIAP